MSNVTFGATVTFYLVYPTFIYRTVNSRLGNGCFSKMIDV